MPLRQRRGLPDLNLYGEVNEKTIGYVSNQKIVQAETAFAPSQSIGLA
jgi:hypothetical protein